VSVRKAPIDWSEIRGRLEALERLQGETVEPSAEQAAHILDARARLLASASRGDAAEAPKIEVLVFVVLGQRYAIETSYVRETVRSAALTPVPGTPPWFLGIDSVRGEIVAVIDLARLFEVPSPPRVASTGLYVVLGKEHVELALHCDEVVDVVSFPRARVVAPPRGVTGSREYIMGMTDDALLVVDGAELLDDPRLFVDQTEEIEN